MLKVIKTSKGRIAVDPEEVVFAAEVSNPENVVERQINIIMRNGANVAFQYTLKENVFEEVFGSSED